MHTITDNVYRGKIWWEKVDEFSQKVMTMNEIWMVLVQMICQILNSTTFPHQDFLLHSRYTLASYGMIILKIMLKMMLTTLRNLMK